LIRIQIKILSKTNQALRGQLKEKDATISSLGEYNREQQLQINQVTARCECLEKENVAYKEQIGELNNRNTTLAGQVEELKGAMDGLKYAMEEFTRTFTRSQ
jgi:predicted nuclease with TOPRIM domain